MASYTISCTKDSFSESGSSIEEVIAAGRIHWEKTRHEDTYTLEGDTGTRSNAPKQSKNTDGTRRGVTNDQVAEMLLPETEFSDATAKANREFVRSVDFRVLGVQLVYECLTHNVTYSSEDESYVTQKAEKHEKANSGCKPRYSYGN